MKETVTARELLLTHSRAYPLLSCRDVLKWIHQSVLGCGHMVASPDAALAHIRAEVATLAPDAPALIEPLGSNWSRVHLGYARNGLAPDTLGKLFYLSARQPVDGTRAIEPLLAEATVLAEQGAFPFSAAEWHAAVKDFRANGYPAQHHSEAFRAAYSPAYRVIANRYLPYLPLLCAVDRALERGSLTLAVEGGSASGKSTLGDLLATLYGCTVLHMDDFFLRPEQRTAERLGEIGGNVDRERVLTEVLLPLSAGRSVTYRPFDCSTGTLAAPVTAVPTPLTVVEGAYSMHPDLAPYYGLSVFLSVSPEQQHERILRRNTPALAKRFFEEWIPMETRYFEGMDVVARCDMVIEG